MFIGAGVGLAVTVWTLNRLRDELQELNRHQIIYRHMWLEERDAMHKQMEDDEELKDEVLGQMQKEWSKAEKEKRAIMKEGLQQQMGIAKVLREGAAAKGLSEGTRIPRPGDADFEIFKGAMVDYAQSRFAAMGRGDQR